MPLRGIINRTFLAMCVAAGLDSAILDPNDRALMETMMAAEMLMGKDRFCMGFNKAYRAGRIGPLKVRLRPEEITKTQSEGNKWKIRRH